MAGSGENDRPRDEAVLSPDELDIAADENVERLDDARFVVGADGPPDLTRVESRREAGAEVGEPPDPDATAETDAAADGESAAEATPAGTDSTGDTAAGFDEAPETTRRAAAEETSAGASTGTASGDEGADTAGATDSPASSADRSSARRSDRSSDRSSGVENVTGADVKRWLTRELASGDNRYAYRIVAKTGDSIQHQQLASDDIGVAFDSLLHWYARQVGDGTAVEEALGILLAESDIRVRYPTPRLLDYLEEHDLGPDDTIADLVNVVHEADGLVFPRSQRNQK